ncbi:MAG: HAMP domain-containing histidine kinase [Bradyrhizobiaceae bacterium]|nr:HAMP domain-containing histidine kinase [Bradyrhizobiaceae bacterium]
MKWSSLRLRLIAAGIVAILIALTIAGGGLVLLFERHVARTLAGDLDVHLKQLLAAIDVDPQGNLVLTQPPADPRFADPLSGLYWQVSDDRHQLLRSRSLWDTTMMLLADQPVPGEVHQHEIAGPGGVRLLVAERVVSLMAGDRKVAVRLAVATDLARVSAAASAFAKDLAIALGFLACVLVVATSIQVGLGLRPLDALRRGIADIRAGRRRHLPSAAPAEVQPLVEEVNALIDAQEGEIQRSRSRAADLAHGLKTPLAALAADATRLHERGEHAIAQDIETVGEAMSRHVDRELARARVRGHLRRAATPSTELAPLVRSLIATLARTPAGARVMFEPEIADDVRVPLDRTDLAEVLGNLLENAARHAKARVRVSTGPGSIGPSIVIEDDGKGIGPAQLPGVLERGVRLDERSKGAGLGLAIVQDVLEAYDWQVDLAASRLGGLKATISPKVLLGSQSAPFLADPVTS